MTCFFGSPPLASRFLTALGLAWVLALPAQAAASDPVWLKAINSRDAATLQRLLEETDPPVRAAARNGVTALMVAARTGSGPLVERLLERGARVEAQRRGGATVLHYAAQGGRPEVIRRLVEAGAELDAAAANGWTALTVAAATGGKAAVVALLEAGADPNISDIYGWTPLMRALDNGYPETAAVLLDHPQVRLDLTDDAGMTALHHAARNGMERLAARLMDHCANPSVRDQNGFTPAMLARRTGHDQLAPLLDRPRRGCAGPGAS